MNEHQTIMMNQQQQQQQQQQLMNLNQNMMNSSQITSQSQAQMVAMNRGYNMWPQPQSQPQFQNPNPAAMKPPTSGFKKSLGPRNNWKGKKVHNKLNDRRRNEQQPKFLMSASSSGGIVGGVNAVGGGSVGNLNFNNYQPPTLNELQQQNRLKTRKFFPKKKFNKNTNMNMGANTNNYYYNNNNNNNNSSRSAPFAPRNTTSYLIRAKKSGGIASLVSPSPMTPAVLPTPIFSPSREVLVDAAKEEWGVDGYGSMKGLIRLRSPGHELEVNEDEEEEDGGSSESDVEEHVEVERRLDHDLSRFEMIYDPNNFGGAEYQNVLENRVDDQDTHIAHLEEENLILKERLFLMERELADLRRRMQHLERMENKGEEFNEEVVENDSENDSGSRGEGTHFMEENELNDDNIVKANELSKEHGEGGVYAEGFYAPVDKSIACGFEPREDNNDSLIVRSYAKEGEEVVGDEDHKNTEVGVVTNTKDTDVEGEGAGAGENGYKISDDREEGNDDEGKPRDLEVEAENNADMESSEDVVRDLKMEEVGAEKDDMELQNDPAN
ncbi:uncharacterized protein LOC127242914 [Andrographis paniculata]|uniref:uncharacterized protein LOC127242914 n=1 Tax=Andrographis paniculata TaxID=175694 RepID=UPI0021E89404|nr:uncharacterized protein LOC127242914 [Andrographis paniculata]